MKQNNRVWLQIILAVTLCAAGAAAARGGTHADDGIVGMTRKNGYGCVCHGASATPAVQVAISGPATVVPGGTASYTVSVTGGPGLTGGFNVAAGHGTLVATDPQTRIMGGGGELAHAVPRAFAGSGSASWTFTYRAPLVNGPDTLFAVALSSDNNGLPTEADQWNFSTNLIVTTSGNYTPVPSVSGWGFLLLGISICAAGSGALLLRRRRV